MMPGALAHDWRALNNLIDHYGQRQPIPCRDGYIEPSRTWTSEKSAERDAAAEACGDCPALTQCRDYGITHPEESGVYGGLTDIQRRNPSHNRVKEGQ